MMTCGAKGCLGGGERKRELRRRSCATRDAIKIKLHFAILLRLMLLALIPWPL